MLYLVYITYIIRILHFDISGLKICALSVFKYLNEVFISVNNSFFVVNKKANLSKTLYLLWVTYIVTLGGEWVLSYFFLCVHTLFLIGTLSLCLVVTFFAALVACLLNKNIVTRLIGSN